MLWIKKKNWRVEQEVKKCHFRAGILNWNQKMDSDVILKPGPELKSAQISIQGGAEQRVEMGFFCAETFFNFFQKQKKKFWDFKSGGYEKWQGMAGMGQRWDLNPGLSREVRELSWDWELIFLELFLFVETFFKRKKKKKENFSKEKKKKVLRSGGDDDKMAGMGQGWDLNPGLSREVRELRWDENYFFWKLFLFVETFFKRKRKENFSKKKKKVLRSGGDDDNWQGWARGEIWIQG